MQNTELFELLAQLETEQINQDSKDIDILPIIDCLKIINNEDKKVASLIENILPEIEKVINFVITSFKNKGRLIYLGAGTSGRLGILDAAECPPTFGSNPDQVIGLIAGGQTAILKAIEGAEDSNELPIEDLKRLNLNKNDTVIGLASSGRTPYVISGLKYSKQLNCKTSLITTVSKENIKNADFIDIIISVPVGPEVIMGSTRMKSGTAQKMILNMISTISFVKLGKTYNNVMVDLQMTNEKLVERSKKIVMLITGVDYETASNKLDESMFHVKHCIVMILLNCSYEKADLLLKEKDGFIKQVLN